MLDKYVNDPKVTSPFICAQLESVKSNSFVHFVKHFEISTRLSYSIFNIPLIFSFVHCSITLLMLKGKEPIESNALRSVCMKKLDVISID